MISLNIDTSTSYCSTALTHDGDVVCAYRQTQLAHAAVLPLFVQQLLKKAKEDQLHIDAVAVSKGPGSYTGLRIATATAKGLCYSLHLPLLAIDTLQVLCMSYLTSTPNTTTDTILCPMIDARRSEVYCALYNYKADPITQVEAKVITENSFREELENNKIIFFGDGADKCKTLITHPNAIFVSDIIPDAASMGRLAQQALLHKRTEDIAYFSPFYLKPYNAVRAENKVLKELQQ